MTRIWPACIALLCLTLTGCVSIPNAKRLSAEPTGKPPVTEGAQHPLAAAQSDHAMTALARFPGDDEALQRQVALEGQMAGTPLVAGNRVTLLKNGQGTYDAMMRAILAAQDHISLESYIFASDSIGQAIADLLIERHKAGIAVQVIYDSQGSVDTPTAFWDRLRAAGILVLEYNPVNPLRARVGYAPNDRDHRKLLVVDGKIAIMGGINITEIYLYGGEESGSTDRWWIPWRDTDIEVEGPMVAHVQQFFLDTWNEQQGAPLPDSRFFPALQPEGSHYIRAVPGTPQQGDPEIYVALLSAIRHAERSVWLTTAYFDPPPEALRVLRDAALRGVDVQLVVQGQSDSDLTLAAGRSHYTELLQAGVKIFERRDVFLHGKTATIDGVWSIVGSSNLDTRSVIWNNELSAIVLGHDFAGQMEAMFAQDRKAGTAIDLKSWANRPLGDRLEGWGARLIEGLL